MLLKALLFASVGLAMEVVFTAAMDYPKTRSLRLMGYTYVWMLPIYGSIPFFLDVLHPALGGLPLPARLAVYVGLLYVVEYATGWLLRKGTGACPWDYGRARWAVHGLIRLDYFPAWALACGLFERLYLELAPL
jgi:uncharacterized membrane protein